MLALLRRRSTALGLALGGLACLLVLGLAPGPSTPAASVLPLETGTSPAAPPLPPPPPSPAAPPADVPPARGWQGFVQSVDDLLALIEQGRPGLAAAVAQSLSTEADGERFGPGENARAAAPVSGLIPHRFEEPATVTWRGQRLAVTPRFGGGPGHKRGASVVYRLAPGLDIVRVALEDRLEELIVVSSPEALVPFSYRLDVDPGVVPRPTGIGSVELVRDGTPWLRLNPVEALDAGRQLLSGSWEVTPQPDGSLLAALAIDLSAARFPVAIDPGWSSTATMNHGRHSHSLVRLADGQVLALGGYGSNGMTLVTLSSAERFDPATNTWSATATPLGHYGHVDGSATLLPDGRVLAVQGGASLYDPATDSFTPTATPRVIGRRAHHTATLLPSGRVLVCGGKPIRTSVNEPSERAELYDPATDVWTELAPMAVPRAEHSATLLDDGRVLIAGGQTDNFGGETALTELYTEGLGFSAGPDLPDAGDATSRWGHTATKLADGRVLLAGGRSNTYFSGLFRGFLFEPGSDTWSAPRSMRKHRYGHTATLLDDGTVLLVGGDQSNGSYTAACALYDPVAHQFVDTSPMPISRTWHGAVSLGGNAVLVVGGASSFAIEATALSYDVVLPPPPPSALAQYDAGVELVEDGLLTGTSVDIAGTVERPDGGLVALEVTLVGFPDPQTFGAVATSAQVDGAGSVQVSFSGLLPGSYRWTARALTDQGLGSVEAAPHAGASFTVEALQLPAVIADLGQQDLPGGAALPVGATASGDAVRLHAQLGLDDAVPGLLALEVEVLPVGQLFAGQSTVIGPLLSVPVQPGSVAAGIELTGLSDGPYHWRARAISSNHAPSAWSSFGGNAEDAPDFVIATAIPSGYTTDFEGPLDWELSPADGVGWGLDASPATVAGGAFQSASRSLNYNDGTDYDNGVRNSGSALSPPIELSGLDAPILRFACNYHTETTGSAWDQRWVRIRSTASGAVLDSLQLYQTAGRCGLPGTWHTHDLALDPAWGNVRVELFFDTRDGLYNQHPGWFVDDLTVAEDDGPPPPPPGMCYDTGFETGVGWTVVNSDAGVGWALDDSAALPSGAALSGLSLNYNDGLDYDSGTPNSGTATSPPIDLSACATPKLRFWCQFQTETLGTSWDQRWVRFRVGGLVVEQHQLSSASGCEAGMGVWHEHEIALDPAWDSVEIELFFDTRDGLYNHFGGWAVDDLSVGD